MIEQVVGGCVTQGGEQRGNIARTAWLAAGLPYDVAATTIDAQCGSGQQAGHLLAGLIAGKSIDFGIAAGVESMSRVPLGSAGPGDLYPPSWDLDLPGHVEAAERLAGKFGIGREAADGYGLLSQERALQAVNNHRFKRETFAVLAPVTDAEGADHQLVEHDEGVRETSLEALGALKAIRPGGVHTAGNTSQVSDGAAAVLWASKKAAKALGMRPRARVVAQTMVGTDPALQLDGSVEATKAVLGRSGLTLGDMDVIEVNEAFAAVVLAWGRHFDADMTRVNVNGGAISLGHPVGATGARLIVSALHELERIDGEFALVTMCAGGGMASGTILQRL
jgi:acetyl-CoA C-acetyltransferase